MNKELLKNLGKIAPPVILGGIAIILQFHSGGSITNKEQALISTLQLLSSVWFGWVIANISSEQAFLEKQKKFAFSAYRRIKEIEIALGRLFGRVDAKIGNGGSTSELDVVKEIALSLQTTVQSSKADWADIIGEEIQTLEKIERLGETELTPNSDVREKTKKLIQKLPESLKVQARDILYSRKRIAESIASFSKELADNGYLEFQGFWDPTFDKDIFSLPLGTKMYVSVDDVGGRVGTLIAHTDTGESLGVITNRAVGVVSYHEFTEVVMDVLGKSKFVGEYSLKGELYKPKKSRNSHDRERHYFKMRVKKQ